MRGILVLMLVLSVQMPAASERILVVPSREFPTIQDAIDAAPEGAVIRIRPGVYRLIEPIWIRSKKITLVGGAAEGRNRTELLGPLPTADDRVADPARARGVVNVVDSSVVIGNMLIRGFDAGVIGRQTSAASRIGLTTKMTKIAIRDTGRGILWKAHGKLTISDTQISDVPWNGISLAPDPLLPSADGLFKFAIESVIISDFGHAGIVYIDDPGVCDDDHTIENATLIGGAGPAIVAIRSGLCIFDSHIALPTVAGIVALSAAVLVQNTRIFYPLLASNGEWGTGIVASALTTGRSVVTIVDNEIKNSERNYITNLGSHVVFTGNQMMCKPGFDLEAGSFLGFPFSFDAGGNGAQCSDECPAYLPPSSFRTCKAESAGPPGPPDLATPLE
jgi:hypothetical protein